MPAAYDPFGLSKRKEETVPRTGPSVPNMGGFPTTPLSPAANLNPFAIPPVATPDAGGRPTEGAVGGSPATPAATPPTPTAAASPASPPTEPASGGQPPASTEAQPASGVTINIGDKKQEGPQPSAPAGTPTAGAPGAAMPAPGPVAGLPAPVKLDRFPTQPEMSFAPPGSVFETPNGALTRDASGAWNMQLNDAGVMKYKEAKVKAIQKFGSTPFSSDPNAPLPPVEPGQVSFNPFTGTFIGGSEG